ncbi:MAG: glycine cleavage system aminomethyltransferase GcvT [Pseudorhodoplanes sp.]
MLDSALKKTPIHDWHVKHGGQMVGFAGYALPIQYAPGILKEHLHVRASAGLFDVSHMGIAALASRDGSFETVASALEALVPADIAGLAAGQQRYTQLLDAEGGILDDLMVWRPREAAGSLGLVVNAACKEADYAHLQAHLPPGIDLVRRHDYGLFALQGPQAEDVLAAGAPDVRALRFMQTLATSCFGIDVHVSRSGYTGEDGFEISVAGDRALELWSRLADDARVLPIGLGARDSLRLEAGMCLYGNDIDRTTSPVEANLTWSIQKRRRAEGKFLGAARVLQELERGTERLRVGLKPEGRAPVRAGAALYATETAADTIGTVTSGGFGPSFGGPVAMGYVPGRLSRTGTRLFAAVRDRRLPVLVHDLPFVPNRFKR